MTESFPKSSDKYTYCQLCDRKGDTFQEASPFIVTLLARRAGKPAPQATEASDS